MEWASSMLFHPSPCQNLHWRNFTQAVRHLAWTRHAHRMWSCAHEVVPLRSSQKVLTKWYSYTWCSNANWFETHEHLWIHWKLSELTGNCFTYNNLAARSSACWCKYWQNHKQELSLQTGMTWLGQQTKLDKLNQFQCEEPLIFWTLWRDMKVGYNMGYILSAYSRIHFSMASQVQRKVCSANHRTAAHCCSCIDIHRYAIVNCKYLHTITPWHVHTWQELSRKYDAVLQCYVACTCHVWLTRGLWPA